MAEIRDQLVLEIDQALRDVNRLESALDQALAPVEVKIDVDERGLHELESTLAEVQRIADRAATETQSIALAAGKAETNFEDLARAMGITEAQARDLTTELLQSQAASNRLEDAARDVARQLGLSDDEAKRLTGSLRQADRAADDIDTTTNRVATSFGSLRTAAVGVASAFAAIGGAQLLGGALRGANAAIQSFARLEDSINAVNVVFEDASAGVLQFGEDAARSAGLSQEAFNQAVVPIGSLLQNFGFDAREAADAAVILVQRGADLASVYGGTVQDALLAVGAALRGEADPLERYGASISAARVETFALAEGLARTKAEITPAIQLQARYGLILSDTARVAGDYLNTADDLANAQRTAGAELQNFVADIGEDLAPALASLVLLLPEVLDGLRQLVPGFVNAADSAAEFFQSIDEGGSGFRAPLQAISAGLGLVGDAFAGFTDIGSGLFDALQLDFDAVGDQMEQFGDRFARTTQKIVGQNLARNLDAGRDKLNSFGQAISAFALKEENIRVFAETYRTFAIQANLSGEELRIVTQALIDQGAAAGLSADEIEFLNDQITQLNGLLAVDTRRRGPFEGITEDFETITTRFTTFAGGIEDGTDRAATALAELSAAAEAQQARTAAAFDLFAELPDKIKGSFIAAVDALREQVEARLDFDINIAILRALDLDALADEFLTQGLAAAGQLEQAVNDIPEAIEADLLLQGMTDLGQEAFDALVDKFVSLGLTPTDARRLAEELSSPEVIAAVEEAGVKVGTLGAIATRTSYQEELEAELRAMDADRFQAAIAPLVETGLHADDAAATAAGLTIDTYDEAVIANLAGKDPSQIHAEIRRLLTADTEPVGRAAAGGFAYGFQEELASREDDLRTSITNVLDGAIYRDSPPKLFLDAGRDSGEAFWSGFNQAELTLRTAPTSVGGSVVTSSGGTTSGDVNVNINLDNARLNDPVSDVARMAQIAGSVAHTYNQVRN